MNRLGRGLEALLESGAESVDPTTGITTVDIGQIYPNPYQPRRLFDPDKLRELAKSIKENGLIQPIIVTKKDQTHYELIAGERRLEAAKLAGFQEMPVIIRSVSKRQQLQFAIIENIQREDLNAIEEAKAFQQLHDEFGMTHAQISEILAKDRATVTNTLRLLQLNDSVQSMVMDGRITAGHARAILSVDPAIQDAFADIIHKQRLTVRQAESRAQKLRAGGELHPSPTATPPSPSLQEFHGRLRRKYKARVRISEKGERGRVTFYYKNAEERDRLLEQLAGE
jgi:ParB family transcriptional regulator, chromosome partitioning protein